MYAVSACRSCGSLCSAAIVCLISCEYSINCLLSAGVSVGMLAKAAAFNRLHSIHTGHTTQLEFGTYRACCAVLCCAVLCCAVLCCGVTLCELVWCQVLSQLYFMCRCCTVYAFVYVLQQAGGVDGDDFGLAKFAECNQHRSRIHVSGMNLPILSFSFQ